jgi:hypothetical protein
VQAAVSIAAPVGVTGYVTLQNPCPGLLQVRATPDAHAPMVWNEQLHLLGCKSFTNQVTVRGDQPYLFMTSQYPAAVILGDSLPAAQYWLWVDVRIGQLTAPDRLLSLGSIRIE